MELPIPELITVISICSTEGCENSNIGIEIQTVKENPMVICGVCGKTTSLVVLPEPTA
jgi:hypothetical protein